MAAVHDLIFRNARIFDGLGGDARPADLAVDGERIAAIGDLAGAGARREIDADGACLAPGFIDVHTHDDRYVLRQPAAEAKISQGVTTTIVGNCGFSLAPFRREDPNQFPFNLWHTEDGFKFARVSDYFAAIEAAPPALNVAVLVGHSSLRYAVMDDLRRPAGDDEVMRMRDLLREAIADGAIGMSSGLYYPPAAAATTDEVAEVAGAMGEADGIYTAHIRDEGEFLLESIEEAAEIGRRANVQTVISHHKASGLDWFGKTARSLPLIEKLRAGQRLSLDVYPYIASSTALMPHQVAKAGKVLVTWSHRRPDIAGADLDDLAAEMDCDRIAAAERLVPAGAVYFQMDEADVRRVLAFPGAMIGSDGLPEDKHPHPRLWGTFPRVLGHYARDEGVLSLSEAVHRMSGLPASVFGLAGRGVIAENNFADLVLFDARAVRDTATFEAPAQPAAGILAVICNGQVSWRERRETGARPGRPIRLADTSRGAAAN